MRLGMTVEDLLTRCSSVELTEWLGFGEFEAEREKATGNGKAPRGDPAKLTGGL